MLDNYYRVIKQEDILLDLLKVISHHGARLATPIRTIQKMYGDLDLETDPFDDAIFTRSKAKGNNSFPFIDPPYKVKPSTQSIIVNGEKDAKIRERVSGFKDEGEKIIATWTPSSSAKPQDKFKSSSQAKTQSVGSDNSVQKATKSGTTPQILSSSNETSPSKKDEEK
jgi:MscS family membrane protein